MRISLVAAAKRRRISWARVVAWTLTFTGHALLIAQLLRVTDIVPPLYLRTALTVDVDLPQEAPPAPPARPEPEEPRAPAVAIALPTARAPRNPPAPVLATAPIAESDSARAPAEPNALSQARRFDEQRAAIAADIARENAPKRRFLAGRSIDGMLPGASNGKLPGFHPKTNTDLSDAARRLGQMLQRGLPTAAVDPDAPTDLLTEGWEAASHGSDLADCMRKYATFDPDLQLQLCGEVRPPQ